MLERLSVLIMVPGQADSGAGPPHTHFVCKYFRVLTQQQLVFTHTPAKRDSMFKYTSIGRLVIYKVNSKVTKILFQIFHRDLVTLREKLVMISRLYGI